MRLRTNFVIVSLALASCSAMPVRPVLEKCKIWSPTTQCVCGMTDKPDAVTWHPLEYCNRATALRPPEQEKQDIYIKELEDALKRANEAIEHGLR